MRFKKLDDGPLEEIGEAIKRVPAKKFIAMYGKPLGLCVSGASLCGLG